MVDDAKDESKPSTQEKGTDIAIAPVPIDPTCRWDNSKSIQDRWRSISFMKILLNYQKLLKKAKVGKHADNDKNW